MTLDKEDLKEIKKIVSEIEDRLNKKIQETEKRIVSTISTEVSDLADINRAALTKIDELDYRQRIVERKLKIGTR